MSPCFLAGAALFGTLAVLQPFRPYVVSGESMSPTFGNGQIVIGNVRPTQVARGDVVVFRKGCETMIKRVLYLPHDRIDQFYVVGEWRGAVNDLVHRLMVSRKYPRRNFVVPEGALYVVGDNAQSSLDSRRVGPIEMSDVVAVVPGSESSDFPWFVGVHETARVAASL